MQRSMNLSPKSIVQRLLQATRNAVSKIRKPILPVLVWIFISFSVAIQAQSEFCSFGPSMQQMIVDYPDLAQEIPSNEAIIQNMINENPQAIMNNSVYFIPVVFHVIHLGESVGQGSNISDAQINQALQDLNDDFRDALGLGNDVEIEFCLAERDPSGNSTSGINRVNGSSVSNYASFGIQSGVNEVAVKALSIWPNKDYLNIWIVHNIANPTGALGFSYFPGAPSAIDGIVLAASATGTNGNSGIISHEAGHYFQLYHTFEGGDETTCPPNSSCQTQGDRVCDTHPHKLVYGGCDTTGLNVCDGSSNELVVHNHMNYTDNSCRYEFTHDQVMRMRAALMALRPTLLYSLGCEPACTTTIADFTVSPSNNDIPIGSTLTFSSTSTGASSYLWLIDGHEISDLSTLTHTFLIGGEFEVCLYATGTSCTNRKCKEFTVFKGDCISNSDTCQLVENWNFEQIANGNLFPINHNFIQNVCGWRAANSSPYTCSTPDNNVVGLRFEDTDEGIVTKYPLNLVPHKECVISFDYLVTNVSPDSLLLALTTDSAFIPLPSDANIIATIPSPAVAFTGQKNDTCPNMTYPFAHYAGTFTYNGDGKRFLRVTGVSAGLGPESLVFIDNVSINCCGSGNCEPQPDFESEINGCTVTFTGTNTGDLGDFLWDFGDNSADTGAVITHEYLYGDTFTVCLTIPCDLETSKTICKEVIIPDSCDQCLPLDPVTAAICDTSSLEQNIFLANFSFQVPAGYKSCKPGNLFVGSPNATIAVTSYTIEPNGLNELVTVAMRVIPFSLPTFLSTGAVGHITLCSDTSDMICREFRILPQVCDNCMDEIHLEAYCADPDPHDDVYIYQGSVTVTVPSGSDSCAVFSPLSGFSSTFTQNSLTNWTVNFQITTHDKNLMYATALLCFVELTTGKTCIPLDITLLPCDVPDECVAEWSPKNMSCTGEEDGNYVFNISKSVYAGPYELCGGGLFGTIDGGGTVRINPIGNSVILNVFTFNIDILIPIDSFVDGQVYNLRLFLCDHLGNIVCYYFPLRLYCSGHRSGSGARNSDAARFNDDAESAYTIRPNPAKDKLMVVTKDFDREKQQEVRIMDQLGRTIIKRRLSANVEEINVATQLPGVYVVAILEAGIPVKIEKIVIIR